MSRSTKRNAVEKHEVHVGTDGLSYALECVVEEEPIRGCSFCEQTYRNIGAQIQTECGLELCPACVISGPRAVARKARKRRSLKEAVEVFETLDSFRELPGGVLAEAIAGGYQELETRAKKEA